MPDLKHDTPLNGFKQTWNGLTLAEASNFEIVSMAIANDQSSAFEKLAKKALGSILPKPNQWEATSNGKLLWTGQNQYFLFEESRNDRLDEQLFEKFGDLAYLTLQTDGWAALDIYGPRTHVVLERFIPLEIDAKPIGFGARTNAQHMSLIILKTETETYRLLTPRSSSTTFVEALTHVAENVIGSI